MCGSMVDIQSAAAEIRRGKKRKKKKKERTRMWANDQRDGLPAEHVDMWRTYCCLTSFFPIVDTCLSCEDITRQSCAMVPRWRFLASCVFREPRAAGFRPAS